METILIAVIAMLLLILLVPSLFYHYNHKVMKRFIIPSVVWFNSIRSKINKNAKERNGELAIIATIIAFCPAMQAALSFATFLFVCFITFVWLIHVLLVSPN
jgi:hypothetical protein